MLGSFDTFLLWTNFGISILVLVSAAYLGLSLKQALLATLLGGLIGNAMLGVAALIGADARVPSMVLQRAPLGQRGSYLATGLNVAAVPRLGDVRADHHRDRGVRARASARSASTRCGSGSSLFGALATALALLGPIGFVRRFVRKFAIWAVALSIAYLAWWIPAHANLHELWTSGGSGGSFFAGMDLIIALSVSWIPLVADYTRFSTGRRAAFWGAGLGYLFPTLFQFGFGAILVLSHPSIGGPADVLTTIAAGGVASCLALLALTVDETDEAFANVYSTAVSMQNFVPDVSQRALIVGCSAVATVGALAFDLTQYSAVPLPARRVLRPAVRRPARRLDPARDALHARRRLRGPGGAPGDDRRVALRLPALRVARAVAGARLLDDFLGTAASAALADRRVAAELRALVRARVRSSARSRAAASLAPAEG